MARARSGLSCGTWDKYEDIYLNGYETVPEITDGVNDYFTFYHHERPHQSMAYATPAEIYRAT